MNWRPTLMVYCVCKANAKGWDTSQSKPVSNNTMPCLSIIVDHWYKSPTFIFRQENKINCKLFDNETNPPAFNFPPTFREHYWLLCPPKNRWWLRRETCWLWRGAVWTTSPSAPSPSIRSSMPGSSSTWVSPLCPTIHFLCFLFCSPRVGCLCGSPSADSTHFLTLSLNSSPGKKMHSFKFKFWQDPSFHQFLIDAPC